VSEGRRDDSLVRDHLANERTFLAWLRTGAAGMSVGVGIARFVEGGDDGHTVLAGVILVVVGALGVAYGTVRYRRVARRIERGDLGLGEDTLGPTVAAVTVGTAILAAFALLGF
jgi:putative membrane protein